MSADRSVNKRHKVSSSETPDSALNEETLEWWALTPAQRFVESQKLWATYLALGGSLDPEPDSQSPFFGLENASPIAKRKRLSPDWIRIARSKRISLPWEKPMIAIRIPKSQWGKAWRAMIELGPVRLVAKDPIYEVSPAHLELLISRGFTYEIVRSTRAKID